MSSTDRQNNLLVSEDWQKIYRSFKNADFQSYDFDNLRRTMIDYIRTNFPEDFNDYIESSEYLALIDLIAYVGQSIAFRVDLNARENFLELASRRESILRLARLISYNPTRNTAANGLLKFSIVQTTENVIDSNGRNLSGQAITWNDSANANWYDQFIRILNAAFPNTQQFGNPADNAKIYGIPTAQYRFNSTNKDVPVFSFSKPVAGSTMNFEITSTTFANKDYIYEESPFIGRAPACIYTDDGYGAGSAGTGFFFRFTQGSLNTSTFTISQPTSNQQVDVPVENINNSDIWLYDLNQSGLENTLWTQVPSTAGNNAIYNSISNSIKTIYSVITRLNDAVSLQFSDGTFGKLPQGSFRVYYRVSNNLSFTINPADIRNVSISINYLSTSGQEETLTIYLNLVTTVSNSTTSETNASIKSNAPQTYYTQNRMITGEDYNISPLSASLAVAKVKSINRTSSGISRYFDLKDPTGKYSSTNLFADDGILYKEKYKAQTTFTFLTQSDIEGVISNTVYNIFNTPDLRNFFYDNYLSFYTNTTNVVWNSITADSNETSGYIGSLGGTPLVLGSNSQTSLLYVTPGALIKFTAPVGSYFNTKQQNAITSIPANGIIPTGGVDYLWAEVVSVVNDGTASGSLSGKTGVLTNGYGPVVLNKVVPANSTLSQIIPKFTRTLSSTVITTMIDLIFANQQFGLSYNATAQTWQLVFETNLDVSDLFSLGSQGDTSNSQKDSSWLLLFTTNNEYYTITSRMTKYTFESDNELTFYFDTNQKIYDVVSSSVIKDNIKILNINTKPDSNQSFTVNSVWEVISEYNGEDGYIDPKKVSVSFADTTNNGVVDDPSLFLNIVAPDVNSLTKYIVQQKYLITEGQEDYKYIPNDSANGPVVILPTETGGGYTEGLYYYFIDKDVVKYYDGVALNPSLDYKVYAGRDNLRFQYTHSADYDSRIDPGSSNIVDMYVLTTNYDTLFRQWVSNGTPAASKPLPPSTTELNTLLSSNLNLIKSISDEIIYHPVGYILLFGGAADAKLQATFNVIQNSSSTASHAAITARILSAINQFFALENWNFGDTFYFTELSTYVLARLSPDITSLVIVPKQANQYFGSLFEISCPSDSIFISCAQASDISIVSGLTSTNLKTVTGAAITTVATSQNITSANNGASF